MMEYVSDRWIEIAVAAVSATFVAVMGGLLTDVGAWYESLRFPSWRPPNWLFGPAWTLIFVLIASSGIVAWERAPDARARLYLVSLLGVNAVFNILWSALFFKLRRPDWAMVDLVLLWLSILSLVVFMGAISTTAGALIFPYLAWVTFAGVLNWRIVRLNAPFGETAPSRGG